MVTTVIDVSITAPRASKSPKSFEVWPCRWAWCRRVFDENSMLVSHVVEEHIRTAVPVRRKDIQNLKRIEDGVGETLSLEERIQALIKPSPLLAPLVPTFESLSSPAPSTSFLPTIPASPLLDDLVRGQPTLDFVSSLSQDSNDSADAVEQQLTQSSDLDFDVDDSNDDIPSYLTSQTNRQSIKPPSSKSPSRFDLNFTLSPARSIQSQAPYNSQC